MDIPTPEEFKKGYQTFQKYERRDAMYKIATFLIDHFWGKLHEMADSLGVLLLTWNQAFYRYGPFDFDRLEEYISEYLDSFNAFRERDIQDYSFEMNEPSGNSSKKITVALQICEGANKGNKGPVGSASTLYLLAPGFFPLWDDEISHTYDCYYVNTDLPEDKYIIFIKRLQHFAMRV